MISALCPPGSDGPPPLHRPITLPCGHTISAEHISVPAPPPLLVASDLPHELFAAQQRQNQQRLNLWAGIMCPIPTCKRYSAQSGTATALDPLLETPSSPTSITSGAQRGEVLASGVTYYPSPNLRPPSYSHDPQATVVMSSPMVDICVDKTLQVVLQELAKEGGEDREKREAASSGSDSLDDQDSAEYSSHTSLSPHLAALGQPEMPPSPRRLPKRRRNQSSSQSRMPRPSLDSPELWPFQKELSGILECDVCAMLLHEPVTTPCQHVSISHSDSYSAKILFSRSV